MYIIFSISLNIVRANTSRHISHRIWLYCILHHISRRISRRILHYISCCISCCISLFISLRISCCISHRMSYIALYIALYIVPHIASYVVYRPEYYAAYRVAEMATSRARAGISNNSRARAEPWVCLLVLSSYARYFVRMLWEGCCTRVRGSARG